MDVIERLGLRAHAFAALRRTLDARGFLEVDTPLLVEGPGLEPHLDPLVVQVRTGFDGPPSPRWLITSPELSMKKLLAHGASRIYQLGHVFRDGEVTRRHRVEFTMLEWYRAPGTLDEIADDTCALLAAVVDTLAGSHGTSPLLDVHRAPERISVQECFARFASIDLRACLVAMRDGDDDALPRAVRAAGHVLRAGADFEDAFFYVMGELVEPHIGVSRLCRVERWPAQMAVLARRCDDDALFAERFELYGGGLELCNAFDELTDAVEQRARFIADNEHRARLGKNRLPVDEEFLALLPRLPRSAGNALGVDRALMLATSARDIGSVA